VSASCGRREWRGWGQQALAFAGDAPGAEIHLLDGGHFLLENQLDAAAEYLGRFLARTLT